MIRKAITKYKSSTQSRQSCKRELQRLNYCVDCTIPTHSLRELNTSTTSSRMKSWKVHCSLSLSLWVTSRQDKKADRLAGRQTDTTSWQDKQAGRQVDKTDMTRQADKQTSKQDGHDKIKGRRQTWAGKTGKTRQASRHRHARQAGRLGKKTYRRTDKTDRAGKNFVSYTQSTKDRTRENRPTETDKQAAHTLLCPSRRPRHQGPAGIAVHLRPADGPASWLSATATGPSSTAAHTPSASSAHDNTQPGVQIHDQVNNKFCTFLSRMIHSQF